MKYQTQKLAYPYFLAAMGLFVTQVVVGLVAGTVYIFPNLLAVDIPFNVLRMIHTNALIIWLMFGFFGAAYYLVPEESENEIHSPFIAKLQFWLFLIVTLLTVIGYLLGFHGGREFLEQPLPSKVGIVVVALLFLYNISITLFRGRKTAVSVILVMGLWGLALFFLFAFYDPTNLAVDKMFWWFVVHMWVEGVWELIMASILAFLLIKMTGIDREVIEKWLYVVVSMTLFSGLLGIGHHYYWIGTPGYWQWIGTVFSTLEVLPFFTMVVLAFMVVRKGGRNHPNHAAMLWALGCAVVSFFGAGVWGIMHSYPPVNYLTHGTQITAAHGHLAFYGAYVMVNLAVITYAMPHLRGMQPYNQKLNVWSFWITTTGVVLMTIALTIAGILQTYMQRIMGISFMETADTISIFFVLRDLSGVIVVVGVLLFVYATLAPDKSQVSAGSVSPQAAE